MEMHDKNDKEKGRDEIFSKAVKAGKRTYFFDVKSTKKNELYLTITESKKRFEEDGSYVYEKHKLFLYKEDFAKFKECMEDVFEYVYSHSEDEPNENAETNSNFSDIDFDDLDK